MNQEENPDNWKKYEISFYEDKSAALSKNPYLNKDDIYRVHIYLPAWQIVALRELKYKLGVSMTTLAIQIARIGFGMFWNEHKDNLTKLRTIREQKRIHKKWYYSAVLNNVRLFGKDHDFMFPVDYQTHGQITDKSFELSLSISSFISVLISYILNETYVVDFHEFSNEMISNFDDYVDFLVARA